MDKTPAFTPIRYVNGFLYYLHPRTGYWLPRRTRFWPLTTYGKQA